MLQYKRKNKNPYKSNTLNHNLRRYNPYNRLRSRYKSRRGGGGGGSGGYRAKKPYTLAHNFRYQPENYRAKPEPRRSQPVIIYRTESNPYHVPRIETNFELEDTRAKTANARAEKFENRLNEKFEERVRELLEKMNSESSVEEMKKELEADLESDRIKNEEGESKSEPETIEKRSDQDNPTANETTESYEDKSELENKEISDELTFEDVATAAEVNESEDLNDTVESVNDAPTMPPEEAIEPNESFAEMAETYLENPLLAKEISPELWPEIEALAVDLEEEIELDNETEVNGY